ncbi:MAG TPA: caspase family protein [Chitinophagales bacterium]|nr:caspase family protein [Chitinophagales bacterium]HRK29125.1 caspase family protein [Chitinophagales bacterium]
MKHNFAFSVFLPVACLLFVSLGLNAQINNEKPLVTIGNDDLIYFTDVIFTKEGENIAAASSSNTINFYDLSGKQVKQIPAHTKLMRSITQLPSGNYVTASEDKSLKIWTSKAELFRTISNAHNRTVTFAAGSPTGNYIISASEDKTAKIWDISGNLLTTLKGHTDVVNAAAFSADEKFVVTASNDNTIRVWNEKGEYIRTFPKFDAYVRSVQYSPDNRHILLATANEAVLLTHVGKLVVVLSGHSGRVNNAIFSPDGKQILTISDDKTIKLWDLEGKQLQTFLGHKRAVTAAAFSPDGAYIVSASLDNTLKIWRTKPDPNIANMKNVVSATEPVQLTSLADNPLKNSAVSAYTENMTGEEVVERTGKEKTSGGITYVKVADSYAQPSNEKALMPAYFTPTYIPATSSAIFRQFHISQGATDNPPKLWAVIIGIANYNHAQSLRFTKDDAYEFLSFLKSPEGGAVPDEQIVKLIDAYATKVRIIFEINRILSLAGPNDAVVIYYAGHGIPSGLLPYDYDGYNNVLPYGDIYNMVSKSKAKYKLCIIDACYAGSLSQFAMRGVEDVNDLLKNYYEAYHAASPGTTFLMSSKAEEKSVEYNRLQHGVFSSFLMRGLKGEANQNDDKIITIQELFDYISLGVKTYTNYSQSPTIFGNYDPNMPVGGIR